MGPLDGVKVLEIAGIGPGPFCATMLADLGAEVVRVDRADRVQPPSDRPFFDLLSRGRRSLGVDLKSPEGVELVLRLVEQGVAAATRIIDGDGAAKPFESVPFVWSDQYDLKIQVVGLPAPDDEVRIAVGSIEPQFYAELLERTGLAGEDLPHQMDRSKWPEMKKRLAKIFKAKSRDEWCEIMDGTDVCFAPVLSIPEAYEHPHNRARGTFVEVDGAMQPAAAPRFSRSATAKPGTTAYPGQHTDETLLDWGLSPDELKKLRESKAIA